MEVFYIYSYIYIENEVEMDREGKIREKETKSLTN